MKLFHVVVGERIGAPATKQPVHLGTYDMLIEIGFWRGSCVDDERPLPFSDDGEMPGPAVLALTLRYLTAHAIVESWEHGYSYCRFLPACTASPRTLGCVTLTDGIYVWPEGLAHYIITHRVAPPKIIVEAAVKAAAAAAAVGNVISSGSIVDDEIIGTWGLPNQLLVGRNHLLWDSTQNSTVSLPTGTKQWLISVSTLDFECIKA